MKIIVACEETQKVCKKLRENGHEAYSCDKENFSGDHPEWHFMDDIFKVIKKEKFGAMIAFHPCTHLAVSGSMWFEEKQNDGRQKEAIEFFMKIVNANIKHIGIENPVSIMSTIYRKPDQIVEPYYFGDPFEKRTCLWLKNLPLLYHNSEPNLFDQTVTHVKPEDRYEWIDKKTGKKKSQPRWYALASKKDNQRGRIRSKTFDGIADAMANQWGDYLSYIEQK